MGRIVAIDFGIKRIGVAISDPMKIIATSLGIVEAHRQAEGTVTLLLNKLAGYEIECMVIGQPLHMNGDVSFLADEIQHFISLLEHKVSYKIELMDERLTTVQAERALREGNMSRKKRAKLVDSLSAVIILQNYLSLADKTHFDANII
ncbi:MAG: Holliday junction resolvase RuvX [Chlamydiales bacterium]